MIVVNTRILLKPTTGVQRYLLEVLPRLGLPYESAQPKFGSSGAMGHLWEQCLLPLVARDRLLWSPVHSGPMYLSNQVVTVHDLVALEYPEYLSPLFATWFQIMLPRLVKSARHIIAVSDFTASRLQAVLNVPASRITVIQNAVDHIRFNAGAKMAEQPQSEAGRRYVLSVATLEPRKNLQRVLEAWTLALPDLPPDVWLYLVGGIGDSRIFGSSGLSGVVPPRVKFLGRVSDDDLPGIYRNALLFVYLSLYEGFGLPVLEAMASGVPVLTSANSAMSEICDMAAEYADPKLPQAIAEKLIALVNAEQKRFDMKQAGLLQAQQHSWEAAAKATAEVLQRYC